MAWLWKPAIPGSFIFPLNFGWKLNNPLFNLSLSIWILLYIDKINHLTLSTFCLEISLAKSTSSLYKYFLFSMLLKTTVWPNFLSLYWNDPLSYSSQFCLPHFSSHPHFSLLKVRGSFTLCTAPKPMTYFLDFIKMESNLW